MTRAGTNPFVGPRPLERGRSIWGRERETADLLKTLVTERVVLLHSPSGAGKTSLVQAGLVAALEREEFEVLPTARVGLRPATGEGDVNRYVWSVVATLEDGRDEEERLARGDLDDWDLPRYLAERAVGAEPHDVVLILDQLEEVLTLDPTDHPVKEGFFRQLGRALAQDRRLWTVLVTREEYVSGLERYARFLPGGLAARFRLERLDAEAAHIAIARTAEQGGGRIEDAAAVRLIDSLRELKVQEADGSVRDVPGPWVEPVQLQVVCRSLWARLPDGEPVIREEEVRRIGDVDTCLGDYCDEQVAEVARGARVSEHALPRWLEERPLSSQGLRSQVLSGQKETLGMSNEALALLVDGHILRREQRRGVTWWELAHDRLVRPLCTANATWYRVRLAPLQRQSVIWHREGRPSRLLLQGETLDGAAAWAEANRDLVEPVDAELLAASQAQARDVRHELEQTQALAAERSRSVRRLWGMLAAVGVLAVLAGWQAWQMWQARNAVQRKAQEDSALAQSHLVETVERGVDERNRAERGGRIEVAGTVASTVARSLEADQESAGRAQPASPLLRGLPAVPGEPGAARLGAAGQ